MQKDLIPYAHVADVVVATFPESEAVLHDLRTPRHSVVYVVNGTVTGRRVGESFEHLIAEAVKAGNPSDGVIPNYYFEKNGRLIRSSTLLIRDEEERLIGALCINIDATEAESVLRFMMRLLPKHPCLSDVLADSLPARYAPASVSAEPITGTVAAPNKTLASFSIESLVNEFIDRMTAEAVERDPKRKRLPREERLALLHFMDERGVFLVKGAMERTAQKLGVSKVTLYADLDLMHAETKKEAKEPN